MTDKARFREVLDRLGSTTIRHPHKTLVYLLESHREMLINAAAENLCDDSHDPEEQVNFALDIADTTDLIALLT
jgi:hypothetical protein